MKIVKKSICIILALISILALNACGGETTPNSNETTTAPLSASFDFELASGYDAEKNFYQLVANEEENYSGMVVSLAVIKNNEILIESSSATPFNDEKGFIEEKDAIYYIGNGCFFYDNCIWNTNTNQNICLPKEDWGLNITLNNNGKDEIICNNDGMFLFHRSDKWLDKNLDYLSILEYVNEFLLVDSNTMEGTVVVCEALTDVAPMYRKDMEFGPYTNGLISMRLTLGDEYTPSLIDGFYDIEWNQKIDLSEFSTTSDNIGFKDDKAIFEIKNNAGTPYMITMDKNGTVLDNVKIPAEEN